MQNAKMQKKTNKQKKTTGNQKQVHEAKYFFKRQ